MTEETKPKRLPTLHWFNEEVVNKTITDWLKETTEGVDSFDVARYVKNNDLQDMCYLDFIVACTDLDIKWSLVTRTLYHSYFKSPDILGFENSVIRCYFNEKPSQYTFDYDNQQHMSWFITCSKREIDTNRRDRLLGVMSLAINVYFMSLTKDLV